MYIKDAFYFGLTCKKNYNHYLNNYENCYLDDKLKENILMYNDIYVLNTRGGKINNKYMYDFFGHLIYVNNEYYKTNYKISTLYEEIDANTDDGIDESSIFYFERI